MNADLMAAPYLGDEKYWWLLSPANFELHEKDISINLATCDRVSLPAPLVNLYFWPFLNWIPLEHGTWDLLLSDQEVVTIGKQGSEKTCSVVTALADLIRSGPDPGLLPGYRTIHYREGVPFGESQEVIRYSCDQLVGNLKRIVTFAEKARTGVHQILVVVWMW